MKKILTTLIALVLVAGCSTPTSRIRKHPEMYEKLPLHVQEGVRNGSIDIGYNRDAVFIALGKPDRQYTRTTEAGVSEVWSYVDRDYHNERQRVRGRFHVRDADGRRRTVSDEIWVDVEKSVEYEYLRIEFEGEGDGVKAIETTQR